jgi:hypothetical protein
MLPDAVHISSSFVVGCFQFYGHAIDIVVAENTVERGTGFLSWGQWRGWLPADASDASSNHLRVGGTMNNGVQPNLQIQYFDNTGVRCPPCQ